MGTTEVSLFRRNAEQIFNTQGQTKCGDCGGYYPERWPSHGQECTNPPKGEDED